MFKLYHSNKLEELITQLSELISVPHENPLESEIVLIQSQGMKKWISLQIAQKKGVCANIDFKFPNAYINSLIDELFPNYHSINQFSPEILVWNLIKLLPELSELEEFNTIKNYIESPINMVKLYQLSLRIADLFDQYFLFRNDTIVSWFDENSKNSDVENIKEFAWQPILVRELKKLFNEENRGEILNNFFSTNLTMMSF